ncbi:MAG: hypothetical protein Q9227_007018 [Pyrenula ochraceoflavens]
MTHHNNRHLHHGSTSSSASRPPGVIDIFPFENTSDGDSSGGAPTPNANTTVPDIVKAKHALASPSRLTSPGWSLGDAVSDGRPAPAIEKPFSGEFHRRKRANSALAVTPRTPGRSFYHRSFIGPLDAAEYSSQGVREQTAELASLAASGFPASMPRNFSPGPASDSEPELPPDESLNIPRHFQADQPTSEAIVEVSEPPSPNETIEPLLSPHAAPSALTDMIHASPPPHRNFLQGNEHHRRDASTYPDMDVFLRPDSDGTSERTLLKTPSLPTKRYGTVTEDLERQFDCRPQQPNKLHTSIMHTRDNLRSVVQTVSHPKSWNANTVWRKGVVYPTSLLPAVTIGLLLTILDALSYGMILFPLGQPVFADLGADGISIFYVSTIVSQLVFSCGGSIFAGGIGSEMIEVVPFFHKMAFTIMNRVGKENESAILATTILAFAMSSVLTGLVFFLMGVFHVGTIIGYFPRIILIGCIGGVGWFLVATGVEVSARLDGNLEYNLDTLKKLFHADTMPLWIIPLALAITLLVTKRYVKSNFLVGGFFIGIAVLFYFFKFALGFHMVSLRDSGWVFDAPAAGESWYHFYTLYDFNLIHVPALVETIPTMFALTFFGILHVPINVPSLAISTGEDNLNVDRELIAHGISNALSGFLGSIQNYLVYTNSLLFIDSGGDSRLAGILLAIATFAVMLVGPIIIGYIPIMVVGALIFMLGIELLEEALADTIGKVSKLEYLTIVIIVVTMGAYDFVGGILVGIILALVNFTVQTSRKSAIRATYTGEYAGSTVRRHPTQSKFLKEAGQQVRVIKLAGYLFFGTILSVENKIRALIDEQAFSEKPIRFVVIDFWHVNGIDFSAAEAFLRINRLLRKRDVRLLISGLQIEGEVGSSLHNVGLLVDENGVEIFETLNKALESCENSLLQTFYARQEALQSRHRSRVSSTKHLNVPQPKSDISSTIFPETMFSSPRRHQLHFVAQKTLHDSAMAKQSHWARMDKPLPLLLQLFENLSSKTEDFWQAVKPYFKRQEIPTNTVLYERGDPATAFLLLEKGILRAEYKLPQGQYSEVIVEGRPCGELPFFSETERTATVVADEDCVVWRLGREEWAELSEAEPAVAMELLRVVVKLNKERMDAITRYILTSG